MIKLITYSITILLPLATISQHVISGRISDEAGEGLIGANVYIKDSYDGATTDSDGSFSFEVFEQGNQVLVVSYVGYKTSEQNLHIQRDTAIYITMEEAFSAMDAVSISAGSFEASDEKKVVILKSLDIATTAGASADITGALNTLPGTQAVGESGRLFVRGGTSEETKIFIDGAEAANYYGPSANNIPTRSRFSPFLFKGTFFSTGGYSAEYGQALSSALILNTLDPEPVSQVEVSLMSAGVDAAVTRAWDKESIYFQAGYLNFNPYNDLISQRVKWLDGAVSWNGTLTYKKQYDNGARIKALAMGSHSHFALQQETSFNEQGYDHIAVTNANVFATATAELPVGEKDIFYIGVSNNWNDDQLRYNDTRVNKPVFNQHLKTKYQHELSEKSVLNTGVELFHERYNERIVESEMQKVYDLDYTSVITAAYTELDQYLSEEWMFRAGVRAEYVDLLNEIKMSPRFSMAHKVNEYAQVSFASGLFYQRPNAEYLRLSDAIQQEKASHYILNYQRIKKDKIFRVETFYKNYDKLVTFSDVYDPTTYANDGDGYAYGLDIFWRDRGGIKNVDYWVSYSWLQSERTFKDYPEQSMPGFASAHNFSLVLKRWFPVLKSQMGLTYSFTSGRPYDDPNLSGFNESRTKSYHDLSYNIAFLPTANVVVYFSATNLLGIDQVFGYKYASEPNAAGYYPSEAIRLPASRFIFLGCFISFGAFNRQLENL